MNIEVEMYKHKLEDECLRNMKKAIFCEETFASYHENFIEEAMKPDLVGKNVKVTEKQLSHIYKMVQEMSNILCIKQPDTYVFEDVNYNAYVKGVNKSWLEISAKTIERFNKNELRFLIGSQLAHIKSKHIYWNILMEQCIRSEEHTSELQSRQYLVCRLLLEKNNTYTISYHSIHHSLPNAPHSLLSPPSLLYSFRSILSSQLFPMPPTIFPLLLYFFPPLSLP